MGEIESLSDPIAGEIRIAASIPMAAGILPDIVGQYFRSLPANGNSHPRNRYRIATIRSSDLSRVTRTIRRSRLRPIVQRQIGDDLQVEDVFGDPLLVATGQGNGSSRLRNPRLMDLMDRPWCLPPPDSVAGARCVAAFRASGLDVPPNTVTTMSVHLQIGLLATQQFFTMFPGSLMRFGAEPPLDQEFADKTGRTVLADRNRHVERPHNQPGGRAVRRDSPGNRKRVCQTEHEIVRRCARPPPTDRGPCESPKTCSHPWDNRRAKTSMASREVDRRAAAITRLVTPWRRINLTPSSL